MRSILLSLPLLLTLHTRAQQVTNVTAEQQGQELLIHYTLEADGPVEVLLYLSTDRGSRWEGPLKSCKGDVGPNIAPGMDKRIRWNVLQERELVGDGISFKVVAKGGETKPWLNPALAYGTVTDIDGNTYATIRIGKQVWMAENLRTTRYRNGDPIANVQNHSQWISLTTGAWAHYDNDTKFDVRYGKLYNWYAVADRRNVCPVGWHVPIDAEWSTLIKHLEGESAAGGKLKATTLWEGPNIGATNGSGFSGLPGGCRLNIDGNFTGFGFYSYWWSVSESGVDNAWYRYTYSYSAGVTQSSYYLKRNGFAVRCVKD